MIESFPQGDWRIGNVVPILSSIYDLIPAIQFISSVCPENPNSTWRSNPQTLIFHRDGKWIVTEGVDKHGFITQVELGENGAYAAVFRKEKNEETGTYGRFELVASITDEQDDEGHIIRVCKNGLGNKTSIGSVLNYMNGLLTYGLNPRLPINAPRSPQVAQVADLSSVPA